VVRIAVAIATRASQFAVLFLVVMVSVSLRWRPFHPFLFRGHAAAGALCFSLFAFLFRFGWVVERCPSMQPIRDADACDLAISPKAVTIAPGSCDFGSGELT
jgi:hypothetical protein